MTITVIYNDNSSEEIPVVGSMLSGFDSSSIGIKTMTVNYFGFEATFEIEIVEATVTGISIEKLPNKTEYLQNYETLDLEGAKLQVSYNNGTAQTIDVTEDMVTGFDNSVIGTNIIMISYEGFEATFEIEIVEPEIVDVMLIGELEKTEYIQNYEGLVLDGLKLDIVYDNDEIKTIDASEGIVNGFDNSVLGVQTVTIEYEGFEVTFEVTIIEANVIGIAGIDEPIKTTYYKNEEIDLTGGIIYVEYNDGIVRDVQITEEMLGNYDTSIIGTQTIIVTYEGFEITFDITILERTIQSVEIGNPVSKTEYTQYEELELNGATILVEYEDGTIDEILITEDMISGYDSSEVGEQIVTITYEEYTLEFTVVVLKAIRLDITELSLELGESGEIRLIGLPAGTSIGVQYTTNLEVDFDGTVCTVTAVDAGSGYVQFTLRYSDGTEEVLTCTVDIDIQFEITLSESEITLTEGESTTIYIEGFSTAVKNNVSIKNIPSTLKVQAGDEDNFGEIYITAESALIPQVELTIVFTADEDQVFELPLIVNVVDVNPVSYSLKDRLLNY